MRLPVGTRLRCGDALLEITQVGKWSAITAAIYHVVGDHHAEEGVFARVQGGDIEAGRRSGRGDARQTAVSDRRDHAV